MRLLFVVLAVALVERCSSQLNRIFPDDFIFGAATSAYQVEGSWNVSDKGENIWDRLTHTRSELVTDKSNGDVACDSYRLYKRDVQMLKELGVDFYRFSLSWTRILPTGFSNKISQTGIAYYNNLINELIANGIRPMVTMYHWDLPQPIQDLGGWTNKQILNYYEDYARVVLDAFGDRVTDWLTFNEPKEICLLGYGDKKMAPALDFKGVAEYQCAHNLLKAHARVYHVYDKEYRPTQKGRIGLTLSAGWMEPADNSTSSIEAAKKILAFEIGWFSHPIFSADGDYPQVMKEAIASRSLQQGFRSSRLPSFTPEEISSLRGSSDFFGMNHYTTRLARVPATDPGHVQPSFMDDHRIEVFHEDDWVSGASEWMKVVPWGFTKLLKWVRDSYNNPEIIIMENGYCDFGGLNDTVRINYFRDYLDAMLDAMDDGVTVTGYTAWSLMDNMEWLDGYTSHFGLYDVDYNDPNRTRTPKQSAKFYKDLITNRYIGRD